MNWIITIVESSAPKKTYNRVGLPCQTWIIIFTWGELDCVLVQRQRKAISLGKQAQYILLIAEGTAALAASEAEFFTAAVGLFAGGTRGSGFPQVELLYL